MKRVIKFTLEIRTDSEKDKPSGYASNKRKHIGIIELIKGYVIRLKGL